MAKAKEERRLEVAAVLAASVTVTVVNKWGRSVGESAVASSASAGLLKGAGGAGEAGRSKSAGRAGGSKSAGAGAG